MIWSTLIHRNYLQCPISNCKDFNSLIGKRICVWYSDTVISVIAMNQRRTRNDRYSVSDHNSHLKDGIVHQTVAPHGSCPGPHSLHPQRTSRARLLQVSEWLVQSFLQEVQEEHQEQFRPVQLQSQHAGHLCVFNSVRHEKDILVLKTLTRQ